MKTTKFTIAAAALVATAALTLCTVGPAQASPTSSVVSTSASARAVAVVPTINWYGCPGLVATAKWQVAAFAIGYCPSIWFLQSTTAGWAVTNAVVNGACRVPWIVRVATFGRFSTC